MRLAILFLLIFISCSSSNDLKYPASPYSVVDNRSHSFIVLSQLQDDQLVNLHDKQYKITLPDSLKNKQLAWGNVYFTGNRKAKTGSTVFFIIEGVHSSTPVITFDTNGDTDFRDETSQLMEVGKIFVMPFKNNSGKGKFPLQLTFHNQPKDSMSYSSYNYLSGSLPHPMPSYYYLGYNRMNYRLVNLPDSNVVTLFDFDCNGLYDGKRDRIYAGNLVTEAEPNHTTLRYISPGDEGQLPYANNTYQLVEVDPEGNWVSLEALNIVVDVREKIPSFTYHTGEGEKKYKPGNAPYTFFYFWGSWCTGCHYVSPFVDSLKTVYRGKIDFVELNMGDGIQTKTSFIQKYKLSFPGYSIDQSNQDKLHVFGLPSFILADREGFVISRSLKPRLMDSLVSVHQ